MPTVNIQLGDYLFCFTSKQDWINHARSRFACCGVPRGKYIAIDAVGRVCEKGLEFSRAENEGTYPITVYKLLV